MRPLPILLLLAALVFPASGYLFPFDGFDGDQVPIPQVDPPIQPEGWAFSIWLVIYVWLFVSAAFGLWRRPADGDWDEVRLPLLGALALGATWVPIATLSAIWATVVIFVMAALAVLALLRCPARDPWWLCAPVALLAGWLTAASFVALGSTLGGWGILSPVVAALLCLPAALAAALAIQAAAPRAPLYAVAVAWALFGIAMANGAAFPGVTFFAVAGIASVCAVAWARWRDVRGSSPA
jgi:hypothetical protein